MVAYFYLSDWKQSQTQHLGKYWDKLICDGTVPSELYLEKQISCSSKVSYRNQLKFEHKTGNYPTNCLWTFFEYEPRYYIDSEMYKTRVLVHKIPKFLSDQIILIEFFKIIRNLYHCSTNLDINMLNISKIDQNFPNVIAFSKV